MSINDMSRTAVLEEESDALEPENKDDLMPDFGFMKYRDRIQRLLYVPFDKIQKLTHIVENYPYIKTFILDSEDAIPPSLKDTARNSYLVNADGVNNLRDKNQFYWGCRINKPLFKGVINPIDHGRKDLLAIMPFDPDFLVVPKIENPYELNQMDDLCSSFELNNNSVKFILILEKIASVKHVEKLIQHPRVIGAIPGAQDFALDLLETYHEYALDNTSRVPSPQEICSTFLKLFNLLRDSIVRISHKFDKVPIASSSFSSNFETSVHDFVYEILQYGFSARTGIHPDQFPDDVEFYNVKLHGLNVHVKSNYKRKERYFPELSCFRLIKYLRLAMLNNVPGYFTCDKNNNAPTIPNQFGQPVIRMIFLLLIFHLAALVKKKDFVAAEELRQLLQNAQPLFNYTYEIDLIPD